MPTALSALRETVQVLYDVAGSQVLEDTDWNTLIQSSYRKLWRTVVRINKSFRINVDAFTLYGGANHKRSFAVDPADTTIGTDWGFANAAFTTADVGRVISPRFNAPNTAFNTGYQITGYLSPTTVVVNPAPAGGFVNPGSGTVLITGGQIRPLPSDYRETLAVRVNPGTDQQCILERLTIRRAQGNWDRAYRLQDADLYIEPILRSAGNYDHLYIPTCPVLASDADELDAELDQFREFIEYDAANVALSREESERLYEIDFQRAEKDVISWASSQRSADPDVVEDVRKRSFWSIGTP